jgi:hypothetical protein
VELEGQADLPEIVGTGGTVGRIPRRLDGGKEEPDKRADDRDYNEELDEREPGREQGSAGTVPASWKEDVHGAKSGR